MNQASTPKNITKLVNRVRLTAQKSQRSAAGICVIAASKTRSPDNIRCAYQCGIVNFGENYLQEALEKIEALADLDLCWHFIGPIQSNKTRPIAENFDWVHSVERVKTARRLSDQRPPNMGPLQILLQVNISREISKSGVLPEELPVLVEQIKDFPRITLRGLMAIPAATNDEGQKIEPFAHMRQLLQEMQVIAPEMDSLSMGMSSDLEEAIAQGATFIRVGTDIFGPRNG
jgi:pyridoxal phosphate enzyme (YggS family)